jgi:anti-sigma regulatory factor (Ser/Thr protein kinase)
VTGAESPGDEPAAPEQVAERIVAETIGPAGSGDDVTLLVVQATPSLGPRLDVELVGEPGALSAFRQALRRWLTEAGAAEDEVQDTVMAVNEACQNAIEHAYGLAPEPFDVTLERELEEVVVTVRDRGGWREGSSDDRGRGLPLMRALMDAVDIDQRPSGSTIVLRRELRGATPAAATRAAR